MFKHEKQLFYPAAVESPHPQQVVLLQEQLGGGNGELKAAWLVFVSIKNGEFVWFQMKG